MFLGTNRVSDTPQESPLGSNQLGGEQPGRGSMEKREKVPSRDNRDGVANSFAGPCNKTHSDRVAAAAIGEANEEQFLAAKSYC